MSPKTGESPWFWASVFLTGALLALCLAGPRFSWRQAQIERRYQARQQPGHTVAPSPGVAGRTAPGGVARSGSPPRPARISLGPLYWLLSLLLLVSWSVWLWQRPRQAGK